MRARGPRTREHEPRNTGPALSSPFLCYLVVNPYILISNILSFPLLSSGESLSFDIQYLLLSSAPIWPIMCPYLFISNILSLPLLYNILFYLLISNILSYLLISNILSYLLISNILFYLLISNILSFPLLPSELFIVC